MLQVTYSGDVTHKTEALPHFMGKPNRRDVERALRIVLNNLTNAQREHLVVELSTLTRFIYVSL